MECKNRLWHIKALILEEYIPLLIMCSQYVIFSFTIFFPFFMVYSIVKSKIWLIFWLGYFLWVWYDLPTLKTEGRKLNWIKYILSFECIRNYYPLRLIKTHDLDPRHNYILATFPHGIIPTGAMWNFCVNTTNVSQLFPNIDIRAATLGLNFLAPFTREYLIASGCCTTDKENLKYLLNSKPSKAIMLFPGGVKEFTLSHPGKEYKIVKKNRKGFVRIALETGASLVPVFSFGEHNTMDQENFTSPIMVYLTNMIQKISPLRLKKIKGRGIFQRHFGILPHRRAITTVGEPILVPKVENPPPELVDEFHETFYQALYRLFEENKALYDEAGSAAKLIMV